MIEVCQDCGDKEGKAFWEWVLVVLDRGGHEFMSDEEDATVIDERNAKARPGKQILTLPWQDPYFVKLFTFIDVTTGIEDMIFGPRGPTPLRRIRVDEVSTKDPPSKLPKTFFSEEYLSRLSQPQKHALKIAKEDFPL
ncbi:hypothetical protein GYMLUDRAFT_167516 [Collybiopsis luxurians FD-317 M1]|uniref:Uncharacterized protein n=1 Tax=Collybiopsis luxurians FD-317 M1 TaxID=944289 RepID=A0A0D0CP98_9AGAR|nr:hypothetical protein GYMLUDRAFT_167516 [Collybiopsis luxurians FD-317 M1]